LRLDNSVSGKEKKSKKPKLDTPEDRSEFEMRKVAEYQARLMKRMRKPKKIRAVVEDSDKKPQKKKTKKKVVESFEKELADTSTTAVKKHRYGPATYKERKEMGLIKSTKTPGKKFKSKSRYKRK